MKPRSRLPYERHHQPLLSKRAFVLRMLWHGVLAAGMVAVSLAVGVLGYRGLAGLGWVDAIENAAMILAGMGPVSPMPSAGAKLFAAGYALFSGVAFVSTIGVIVAPVVHRLLHHFHLDARDERG